MSKKKHLNRITVTYHSDISVQVTSRNKVFDNERVVFMIDEEKIVIQSPTLDYPGKSYKVSTYPSGLKRVVMHELLPLGKYLIDEDESEEMKAVAYLEDKIIEEPNHIIK